MYVRQPALLALLCPAVLSLSSVVTAPHDHDDGVFGGGQHVIAGPEPADFSCDLPEPLAPTGDGLPSADDLFGSHDALLKQVKRHSALVKVPSICYDDLGDFDKDERWAPFYTFHEVLAETFPLM